MSHRICGRLLLGALLAGSVWSVWPSAPSVGQVQPRVATLPEPQFGLRGAGSCASSACHGGDRSKGPSRSEYSIWMAQDKHGRAYQVLLSERSRIMERNYRGIKDLKDSHPEKDETCLKCHSLDAAQALAGNRFAIEDGVGCERCHGHAQAWLGQHYLPGWKAMSPREKAALGFRDLSGLLARVHLCVDCHVGAPGQEVDHDLYGAGHPRLNFEYAAYTATMPPHWDTTAERTRYPDLEARNWLIGQALSAQKALELLAYRATERDKDAEKDARWPEFAEYDCYACHHDLHADSRRQREIPGRVPGLLPWNSWYYAMPLALSGVEGSPFALPSLGDDLTNLGKEMSKPLPDREAVAKQARTLAGLIGQRVQPLAQSQPFSVSALKRILAGIDAPKEATLTWDTATQSYLGSAALYYNLTSLDPGLRSKGARADLKKMEQQLRYPRGIDSPRDFDPASFVEQLKAFHQHLGK